MSMHLDSHSFHIGPQMLGVQLYGAARETYTCNIHRICMYMCTYIYICYVIKLQKLQAYLDPPASQCKIHWGHWSLHSRCRYRTDSQDPDRATITSRLARIRAIRGSCNSATSSTNPLYTRPNPVPLYRLCIHIYIYTRHKYTV